MSALAHYIELEGIATTGISLVREHSERMQPPRALWVPFELGRPLGIPGDAQFQHRVIREALALLEAPSGPMLADYAEEATIEEAAQEWVCPVSFARPDAEDDELAASEREMAQLEPWFAMALSSRGRTTTGGSGLDPSEALGYIGALLRDAQADIEVRKFNLAVEDLKAFYLEAVTAQPGKTSGKDLSDWFWRETQLSALLRRLDRICADSDNEALRTLSAKNFIPRVYR